jgi:hypothetical protein
MTRRYPAIPPECEECPLPDCYPTDPRCPVLRKKAEERGLTLPSVAEGVPPRKWERKHEGLVPAEYKDRKEYHQKYNREYNLRFRRIMVRGVYLQRKDIDLLRSVCEKDGRTLEAELTVLLELMVAKARGGAK